MLLYHGTSKVHLPSILEKGVQPRWLTQNSNWTCESGEDRVYLTTTYAPYFAIQACDQKYDKPDAQNVPMVIEIDSNKLRRNDLVADEDYMEQLTRSQKKFDLFDPFLASKPVNERTIWFRDRARELVKNVPAFIWSNSIRSMGTCAYVGTVPLRAITKIVAFNPRESAHLLHLFLQPEISLANYRLCGKAYRYWTAKIFDREPHRDDHPKHYGGHWEFPPEFPVKGLHGREIIYPAP